MSQTSPRGISRQGLSPEFEAEEARKSELMLQAALLREQGQEEAAAMQFAEAARIEEHLSELCEQHALTEKAFVHRFSAASLWAQAGNFYQAIVLCQRLLASETLPDRLRSRIETYARTLQTRRAQWYRELLVEAA